MKTNISLVLTGILASILIGCSTDNKQSHNRQAPSSNAEKEISIVREETWQIKGRQFFLRVEELPPLPGAATPQYTLNITGDGPVIQLTYPGEPLRLEVLPDQVSFSSHSFGVTDDPEVFRIDGVQHKLGPAGNRVFVFVNGKLIHFISL